MNEAVIKAFIDTGFEKRDEWGSFHDAVLEAYGKPWRTFTVDQLKEEFRQLSSSTQGIAIQWGLSDTVFRGEAYTEIQKRQGITQ